MAAWHHDSAQSEHDQRQCAAQQSAFPQGTQPDHISHAMSRRGGGSVESVPAFTGPAHSALSAGNGGYLRATQQKTVCGSTGAFSTDGNANARNPKQLSRRALRLARQKARETSTRVFSVDIVIRGERERSPPLPQIMQSRFPHLGNSQGSAQPECNG